MLFAAILAGGRGSRMGSQDKPKQYLLLNEKPIIIYTVEKFITFSEIE
ncbi:MAG: NTP transferase domain-containing protein, partial [Eggerthella sp.]|nr:NTP transferase domain-containing protein [Eggerthella sp.]